MIRLKTSVLIGASLALGAMNANASSEQIDSFYDFGQYMGMSFQIQDDILDAFGEKAAVGKRIGGDILQNKKTLLYLKTLALAPADDVRTLREWYSTDEESDQKVSEVKSIMRDSGALDAVRGVQEDYLSKAIVRLKGVGLNKEWMDEFLKIARFQVERSH